MNKLFSFLEELGSSFLDGLSLFLAFLCVSGPAFVLIAFVVWMWHLAPLAGMLAIFPAFGLFGYMVGWLFDRLIP